MTRTVRTSLGSCPLTGKQAIDQAARFKHQLRSLNPKPESVSLLTVVSAEVPHIGVAAVYDADDPAAVAWVRQAEVTSSELWRTMTERRTGRGM